ncbi:cysteine desulfurase NifS [soil metagenome]
MSSSHVYLDHAATTAMRPEVREAMGPYLDERFGNPSSMHRWGRQARNAMEEARERVAGALGAGRREIIFTGGGTEADNMAILGRWRAVCRGDGPRGAVACSAVEHKAVGAAAQCAADEGAELILLGVDEHGRVDVGAVDEALGARPCIVAVMWANNEVGTVQPIAEIGERCRNADVVLHTDAVQAFGRAPLDVEGWGIGALALSAHKFNGPKGVGVLVLRRELPAVSVLHGGGQERGLRSGTFNAAGIVGCGAAAVLTAGTMATEVPRLRALRDRLLGVLLGVGGVTLNGSATARLPHNANVAVQGCDGEALLLALDAAGVAASTGSACQSGAAEPSHVLAAVGAPADRAHLRFTCGRSTTEQDVDAAAAAFTDCVKRLRDAGGGFA